MLSGWLRFLVGTLAMMPCLVTLGQLREGPIHRYSFNNPPSFDAIGAEITDSVGGAHGIVKGSIAESTGTELILFGGSSDEAAYVDLPNNLISVLTDVTIETWVTIDDIQDWSRVFDFGTTQGGELDGPGGGDSGLSYLFLTASRGFDLSMQRLGLRDDQGTLTRIDLTDFRTAPVTVHYAVVLDSMADEDALLSIYRDGELLGESPTTVELANIDDVNNWLGRSNFTDDANLQGSFDEFRIYDYPLAPDEIALNISLGPDMIDVADAVCGDFDMDGDVDAADRTIQTTGWTGAIDDGSGGASFADGDCDGDGDVDTADATGLVMNWTGAIQQAGGLDEPGDAEADLIYDRATGNVKIDASDTASGVILSFVLATEASDLRPENLTANQGNVGPFVDVGTNTDAKVFQIGQTDPLNQGDGPMIDLGNILPEGIPNAEALSEYLTLANYASALGSGGELDLVVIPEPGAWAVVLSGMFAGVVAGRRRRASV